MKTPEEKRQESIRFVLYVLKHPLCLVSPDKKTAENLVKDFNITVEDLLACGTKAALSA